MAKLISVDEFLSKRSLSAHDGMVYRAANLPKSFNAEERSAIFVMTDETPDSYGDIVKAKGAKLERFVTNPIALRNHRSTDVIGTWSDVSVRGTKVTGKMTLAEDGTSPLVDETYKLMAQAILKAASIGFMPIEIEMMKDDEGRALYEYIIHTWELFECSVVSIPANPNALAKAIKEGDRSCLDHVEYIIDTYTKESGLIVPRSAFEDIRKAGIGHKTSQTVEKVEVTIGAEAMGDIVKKAINDALAAAGIEVKSEPAPDPIVKKLSETFETTFKELESEIDDIPEDQIKRKGLLSRIFDDIRNVFKNAPSEPETIVKEPAPPVLATDEEKEAARRKLLEFEAEDLAA